MHGAVAVVLALFLWGQQPQQQQPVPDAPTPQSNPSNLNDLTNQVAPGKATAPDAANPDQPQSATPPKATAAPEPQEDQPQQEAPEIGNKGSNPYILPPAGVNIVVVPVTVRDSKGKLVPGLTYRDFRVYENKERQRITYFSTDAVPLSVAFVIDQSVSTGTMKKVNESLSAVTGAFTPYDEVAVYTYSSSPKKITDFTGSQGNRLNAALEAAKRPGRDAGPPILGGPLASGPTINGQSVDPNLDRGAASGIDDSRVLPAPREVHTLNDAILFAATDLSHRPQGRRRIIYVISDGKESGSKATIKEVVRFLQGNNISVYGTLVGDAATWGYGYLDRIKLPLLPANNVLPKYTVATGGSLDAEFHTDGIERSFSKIADEVRTQYTIEYHTQQKSLDSRFRTIEVTMPGRPGFDITAKQGYYPTATYQGTH